MASKLTPAKVLLSPVTVGKWLWRMTLDIINEYRSDGVGDLAAQITFWTVFSIPAAALSMLSLLGSLDSIIGTDLSSDLRETVLDYIDDTFTSEGGTIATATAELFDGSNPGVFTVATLAAILGLSTALAGLMRALDKAYDVERGRPWWHHRVTAIVLGVITLIVISGVMILLGVVWPRLPDNTIIQGLRAPAVLTILIGWAAFIFHQGPNHTTPWRFDLPGATLTGVAWLVLGAGYAFYVRLVNSANQVQTTVGAIILALTLLYLLSVTLLVGAEMNSILASRAGVIEDPDGPIHKARAAGRQKWEDRKTGQTPVVSADKPPTP